MKGERPDPLHTLLSGFTERGWSWTLAATETDDGTRYRGTLSHPTARGLDVSSHLLLQVVGDMMVHIMNIEAGA